MGLLCFRNTAGCWVQGPEFPATSLEAVMLLADQLARCSLMPEMKILDAETASRFWHWTPATGWKAV